MRTLSEVEVMLNQKTMTLLANTLAPKVAGQLFQSEEFITFLHEIIPALIDAELGECDDDLMFDLSMMVMERITLEVATF